MSVCLSVCLSVWAITFERLDIGASFFGMVVNFLHIYVKFEYQGRCMKVKVTLVKWACWIIGHQIVLL